MIPKLGEVHIPCDADYQSIKEMCVNSEGWALELQKKNVKCFSKKSDLCAFQMIKVTADFDDINANVLFDVLMDSEYRLVWDEFMVEGYDHCYVTPFSDIGYYCAKSPKPFKNRDFVAQRCWLDFGRNNDKIVFSHSVNHAEIPTVKSRVRGLTYISASYIKFISPKACSLTFVSQSDPGGNLPSWAINKTSKLLSPKFIKKLHKASLKYDKWKSANGPQNKPWENPEVLKIPRLNMSHIMTVDLKLMKESMPDESNIADIEIEGNDED